MASTLHLARRLIFEGSLKGQAEVALTGYLKFHFPPVPETLSGNGKCRAWTFDRSAGGWLRDQNLLASPAASVWKTTTR